MLDKRFQRTAGLIGEEAVDRLNNSSVAVFGVGGVGSYVVEALARSGIGSIDVFDSDDVDITNINRQIIALESTIGRPKVEVAKERLMDINPQIKVNAYKVFITPDYLSEIDFTKYDYVIDAVDNVTAKIAICSISRENSIPIISAMGAGNKLDPTGFEVDFIEKTSVCPLARVMRTELKKRGVKKLKVVYSKEQPQNAVADSANGRHAPGSCAFVPSVAGLVIASAVIKDLIGE